MYSVVVFSVSSSFCLHSHPEVTTDDPEYTDVMEKITEMLGRPTSYGLSPEEQEEEERRKEEEQKEKQAEEAAERRRRNEVALAGMAAQYQEWVRGRASNVLVGQ